LNYNLVTTIFYKTYIAKAFKLYFHFAVNDIITSTRISWTKS